MKDITRKPETLRSARASATIHMPAACVALLRERRTEKGDALEVARTAGILAAKRTWELLPFCHPLPLQNIHIEYALDEKSVGIEAAVEVISGTGVEMEALTAASIAALTLYDMLKPHAERDLSITDVRLLDKRGGKSQYARRIEPAALGVVLVVSDAVAGGKKTAQAGETVRSGLQAAGIDVAAYELLSDSPDVLLERVRHWLGNKAELIITVGGTGIAARDRCVETIKPLLEREMPGIMEAARGYGQRRTPYAMISRGIAGLAGRTLIVTFPGSVRGAAETLDALLPGLVHTLEVLRYSHLPQSR
jgi:molybdenum cofactor biosynthesis protein MoaC